MNYVSFHHNECSINTSVNKLSCCPTLSSNIPSSTFIFSCIRELSISNNKWVLLNIDSLTEFHKEAIFVPENWRRWESTHMASDVHYLLCLINDWWRINDSWWLYWEKKQKNHANCVWLSVSKKSTHVAEWNFSKVKIETVLVSCHLLDLLWGEPCVGQGVPHGCLCSLAYWPMAQPFCLLYWMFLPPAPPKCWHI